MCVCLHVCTYLCVCPWPLPGSANRGGSETFVHRKQTGSVNAILAGEWRVCVCVWCFFDAQVCARALAFPRAYGLMKHFHTLPNKFGLSARRSKPRPFVKGSSQPPRSRVHSPRVSATKFVHSACITEAERRHFLRKAIHERRGRELSQLTGASSRCCVYLHNRSKRKQTEAGTEAP